MIAKSVYSNEECGQITISTYISISNPLNILQLSLNVMHKGRWSKFYFRRINFDYKIKLEYSSININDNIEDPVGIQAST